MNLILLYSIATILYGAAATSTQIIVPLYTYPTDPMWTTLYASIAKYTKASFLIIINPNSGPGSNTPSDPNYVKGITKLKNSSNVYVIAYVHTSYGNRNINDVKSEISTYASWPTAIRPLGIFFDEAAASQDKVSYYQSITTFVRSKLSSTATVVLNAGTVPTTNDYFTFATQVVIHEISYKSYTSGDNKAPANVPASKFCVILYSLPKDNNVLQSLVNKFTSPPYGSIYLTDASNSYMKLGKDWDAFCQYINAAK